MAGATVRRLRQVTASQINDLAAVLVDCVIGGASVGFMMPLTHERAAAFWRRIADDVHANKRVLLVAEDADGICGTAQVVLEQPENQPHRGDIAKMLVHRRARRQGLGSALLQAAEREARADGKSLLVLDTASDDAERLYERNGWVRVGVVPDYALLPAGGLCATNIYYRRIG
jgi:GNAT superfamily N-acetyltransferase